MNLKSLASVTLVGELLSESLDNITETILEGFVHLGKVCLAVKIVLHLLHPLGEFVAQVIQSILKIAYSLSKSIEGLLAHSTVARRLRNLQIGKGIRKPLQTLLKSSNSCFKVTEVLALESLKLGSETIKLILGCLSNFIDFLAERLFEVANFSVGVASQLQAKTLQVLFHLRLECL